MGIVAKSLAAAILYFKKPQSQSVPGFTNKNLLSDAIGGDFVLVRNIRGIKRSFLGSREENLGVCIGNRSLNGQCGRIFVKNLGKKRHSSQKTSSISWENLRLL